MSMDKDMDIDQLKNRWLSKIGEKFVSLVVNPQVTQEEYKSICIQFFGKSDPFIQSITRSGLGRFEDLRGMNLSKRNLNNLMLGESDLSHGNFDETVLEDVAFGGAKLYSVSFKNAIVKNGINFFECYAKDVNFNNARLINANFYNADLERANFANAILENCDFSHAQLSQANLEGVQMINCNLDGAHLSANQLEMDWFKSGKLCGQENIVWE